MAPIPDVLMKQVDEYVDSLAPQIQPRIATELDAFQKKTIDVLENQVIDAFRSLFDRDGKSSRDSKARSGSPTRAAPGSYGVQSLPFADEIAGLTRSFSSLTDEAGDDLRGIFDITEGRGGQGDTRSRGGGHDDSSRGGARAFLSAAVDAVQDHLDKGSGGQGFKLDGILGTLSDTVKDATRNPEEKARLISPDIKEKVGETLRKQHAPIAEQFTRIALDHIKRWLRGNTSTRDIGDGAKGELEDQVKDIVRGVGSLLGNLKHSKEGSSRDGDRSRGGGEDGESGGFSRVISDKLSTGLAKVHREVRIEFRKVLGGIEKQLFELLPDELQRPLEKVLGGNPFDSQLDKDQRSRGDRDIGDDIKDKLLAKIRSLMRKVQETLRESILGVVNGGHRKFERESWVFVQSMVEQKVQRYLPKVKISVPDDIGDEGVSVGKPNSSSQIDGGPRPTSPPHGGRPSSPQRPGGRPSSPPRHGDRPSSPPRYGGRPSSPSRHGDRPSSPPRYGGRPSSPPRYGDRPSSPPRHGYRPSSPPQHGDHASSPFYGGHGGRTSPANQYDGRVHGQQGYGQPPNQQYQHNAPQEYNPPSQFDGRYGGQQGYSSGPQQDQQHGYGGQHGYAPPPQQQHQYGGQQGQDRYSGHDGRGGPQQGNDPYYPQQHQGGSQPDYYR